MANHTLTHSLTNLTHGNVSFIVVPDVGYALPNNVSVSNGTLVSYDSTTGVIVVSGDNATITVDCQSAIVIDPVLENNSWDVIKAVCQAGNAADYWALGDTKTVTGSDSYVRTARIDDMSGLYGKHVVFSFINRTETAEVWATDNINSYANSSIKMRIDAGGSIFSLFVDSELAAQLTDTTVQVAAGGNDGTLVSVTGKMFLPAEREIFVFNSYSRTEEWNALTQYAYYSTVDTSATARLRYKASTPTTAGYWWLRSPVSGGTNYVFCVDGYGNAVNYSANVTLGVAPCFAF